jgi:MFS family permease
MLAQSANVPRVVYLLAVAAGLVGVPFMYLSVDSLREMLEGGGFFSMLIIAAGFALGYAALGAAFGCLWPEAGWRWGVWLCAAPSFAVPYFMPDVRVFLGWAMVALLPACAGAYIACRLCLEYVGAVRAGATLESYDEN